VRLHIEFCLPYLPKESGQGRGNSGVFLQGAYEVQVLDSFGCEGHWRECGALYKVSPAKVNACLPPGQWQTYDVEFRAARFDGEGKLLAPPRISVSQNGIAIHADTVLAERTQHAKAGRDQPAVSGPGPIVLQDHGNPVRFRHVWVRELGAAARRPEFYLADKVLNGYVGQYEVNRDWMVDVTRQEGCLQFAWAGEPFRVFASSPNRFFAKTTDLQVEFKTENGEDVAYFSVGEEGGMRARKRK
jgi:hypothetical protein